MPLTSLPEQLAELKDLQVLDLSNNPNAIEMNMLSILGESFKKLENLKTLNLEALRLKELPEWICSLR
jgi:Leucine-rich repeat (LRR) protein